ncbi:hypothetical protein ACFPRL_14300 [Pseudoclavibacter helvolus]
MSVARVQVQLVGWLGCQTTGGDVAYTIDCSECRGCAGRWIPAERMHARGAHRVGPVRVACRIREYRGERDGGACNPRADGLPACRGARGRCACVPGRQRRDGCDVLAVCGRRAL